MITNAGKTHIKRFVASQVPTLARTLVLGIGETAPVGADQRMEFEVARVPISLSAYDPVEDKVIYKAAIPEEYIGKVYEIGLYSIESDTINDAPTQLITTFDQATETWVGVGTSWGITNTRIGVDSLRLAAAASGTSTATLLAELNLSNHTPTDGMVLAYYASANVANIKVIFSVDGSNYYTGTITSPVSGYNVTTINKSAFVATGAPDWANITSIQFSATATAGGALAVDLDGLSFVDQDYNNPDMVLVARQVLVSPFIKVDSSVNEIEFRLSVSVS